MNAVSRIDHIAIMVTDLDRKTELHFRALEAQVVPEYEIDGRRTVRQLRVGGAMLNVHQTDHGNRVVACQPTPSSADICFGWSESIATVAAMLRERNISGQSA